MSVETDNCLILLIYKLKLLYKTSTEHIYLTSTTVNECTPPLAASVATTCLDDGLDPRRHGLDELTAQVRFDAPPRPLEPLPELLDRPERWALAHALLDDGPQVFNGVQV